MMVFSKPIPTRRTIARTNRISLVLSIVIATSTHTAYAQMGSYEQQKVIQSLRTPQTEIKLNIFDGKNFDHSTDKSVAYHYMVDYINGMNKATRVVNGMTSHARGTTEGQAFIEETNNKIAFARAMQSAYPAFESLKNQQVIITEQSSSKTTEVKESSKNRRGEISVANDTSTEPLPTTAQQASVTVHLDKIDNLLATGPFNGTTFKEGTSISETQALIKALTDAGNAAVETFNALPQVSKQSDDAKLLLDKIHAYKNKKRPVQSAATDYLKIRGAFETAEANKLQEKTQQFCNNLENLFATSNPVLQNIVSDLSKFAKKEGWQGAYTHASIQGTNQDWASEVLQVHELCKPHTDTLNADINLSCRSWPSNDHAAWCRTAEAYTQANEKEIAEQAAHSLAIGPACDSFKESVMTRKHRQSMKQVIEIQNINLYEPKLPKLIRFANSIESQCTTPAFKDIADMDCGIDEPLDNPSIWCQAATIGKSKLYDRIVNSYENPAFWSARVDTILGSAEKLLRNNGWLTPDTKVSYDNLFSYERMLTQPQTNNRSLIETMSLLDIDATKLSTYEDTLDLIDDLTSTIDENAASWLITPVNEDFTGYVTMLAVEKLVNSWHPTAQIKDQWLGSSEWNIERTGLGFIDNRWVSGYVLLKLPEDPYCQLHLIFVTERYDGDKFTPSPNIQTKKMRFQDCS